MARSGSAWMKLADNIGKLAPLPSKITRPVADRLNVLIATQFKTGTNSYGTPWVPLRPSTIRKKGHDTIMVETGKLADETRAVVLPGAGIGLTSLPYGEYHMTRGPYGRAARPVLPHRQELPSMWRTVIREEWQFAFRRTMGSGR